MTVREALREGQAALAGSETPFLDASLLLASALSMDRTELLASGPMELGENALATFRRDLGRRAFGLPLAYILGRKEFYSRSFRVDGRVLIPRPDTETLVEAALALGDAILAERGKGLAAEIPRETESAGGKKKRALFSKGEGEGTIPSIFPPPSLASLGSPQSPCLGGGKYSGRLRVLDLCTGSGCVAISIAAERPEWAVSASDSSKDALDVARENATALLDRRRPGGSVELFEADLFEALPSGWDVVVSNPPYVESAEALRLLARGWSEPRAALDGGPDGLSIIRRLVPAAAGALAPGGALAVEADCSQAEAVAELFLASGFANVRTRLDLAGRPRVTEGRIPWTS